MQQVFPGNSDQAVLMENCTWNKPEENPIGPGRLRGKISQRLGKMTYPMSPVKQLVFRVALPHVVLVLLSIMYVLAGALLFQGMETSLMAENGTLSYDVTLSETILVDELYRCRENCASDGHMDRFITDLERTFHENNVHNGTSQTEVEHRFVNFLFFTVTTVTSLGYGSHSPMTNFGRVFCIIYCLVGIPIVLVTIADVAKFMSEILVKCYIGYRKTKFRHQRCRPEKQPLLQQFEVPGKRDRSRSVVQALQAHAESLATGTQVWADTFPPGATDEDIAELIWENLETTEFVEFPAPLVFVIVTAYATLGALFFHRTEGWSGLDSFYFSLTSLLKIGFGDFVPQNVSMLPATTLYLVSGLVITTMGIDLVGVRYLSRIHQLGRRVEDTDYMGWLIAIQMRRKKRQAMKQLLDILYHTTMPFMKVHDEIRGPSVLSGGLRPAPEPPTNLRVVDTTAHSVLLTWDGSATAADELVLYNIHYRPKAKQEEHKPRRFTFSPVTPPGDVRNIIGTTCEVLKLRSFTLYEFSLCAEKEGGSHPSTSISILHFTEPESVPQRLRAEVQDYASVQIWWNPPIRNRSGKPRKYTIFYTNKANDPFEKWTKLPLGNENEALVGHLRPNTHYTFCVSASHNLGMAMVSRVIAVKTFALPKPEISVDGGFLQAPLATPMILRNEFFSDYKLNTF